MGAAKPKPLCTFRTKLLAYGALAGVFEDLDVSASFPVARSLIESGDLERVYDWLEELKWNDVTGDEESITISGRDFWYRIISLGPLYWIDNHDVGDFGYFDDRSAASDFVFETIRNILCGLLFISTSSGKPAHRAGQR